MAAQAGGSQGELSVREALQAGGRRLAAAGCEQARLDAEVLLAHVLGVTRAGLYAHPERRLSAEEAAAWEAALTRRARREPAAYILGYRAFYDLELVVDRRVLVPRPETELIVDRVLAIATSVARRGKPPACPYSLVRTIWDVGTGSGALALTLARHLPEAHVVGSDISSRALVVAAMNRCRLGLQGRVELVRADLLSAARGPLDVVVANLPYLRSEECLAAMPEVAQYEPRLALDGGRTGLALVTRLLQQATALEPPPAYTLLEIGAGQGPEALRLAQAHFAGRPISLGKDYAGLERILEIGPPPGEEGEADALP